MLGEEIKKYIKENGFKMSYVAKSIGVSTQTFSAMLNSNRKITAEEYFMICKTLGVSLEKFASAS